MDQLITLKKVSLYLLLIIGITVLVMGGCSTKDDDDDDDSTPINADSGVDDDDDDDSTDLSSTIPSGKMLSDVHGAGAQRSDPKSGNPDDYNEGHGPQGDVVYIYNYARCVRDDAGANTTNKYAIVDTGQSKCYDDGSTGVLNPCPSSGEPFYGQDTQYSGNTPSYTDNGDDTITDNVTGLMWQKAFKKVEWADAESDAASATTGGHSDWRVPSMKEMYSLMNFDGATGTADPSSTEEPDDAKPYIDKNYFNFEYSTTGRYIDSQYITTAAYVSTVIVNVNMGEQECFFGLNLADGRIKCYPKTGNPMDSTYYVRYVRGNTNYGQNDFQDNGDSTITDNATGLIWMKVDSGDSRVSGNLSGYTNSDGSLNWEEALSFCENLTFAGANDWRLPNAKELHSIVDYTRSPDKTNSPAIDPVFSTTAIKDKAGNTDYPFFWTSTTHLDGPTLGEYGIYIAFGEAEGLIDASGSSSGPQ